MRTLLLDNTYFPVKVINWQKAMILWLTGRAEVVDVYSEIDIRAPSESFKLPKILRLFGRHRSGQQVKLTRFNLFHRDHFTCQYCLRVFHLKELTVDHIIPISRGGQSTWENLVTACSKCNGKKGSMLPAEAKMYPKSKPRIPGWSPQLCLRLKESDPPEWVEWFGKAVA